VKDHVARLAQLHRVPASPSLHEAIEYVMGRAKAAGLTDAHVETFPGDGTTWFGTLHGNGGDAGWLDEVQPQPRRIISYDAVRLAVADNSESANVTVELVEGTRTVSEIRDAVSAEFDPLPLAAVAESLDPLARAGALSFKR
jgi:hypothetical protein